MVQSTTMEIYPRRFDPILPLFDKTISESDLHSVQTQLDGEIKSDLEALSWEQNELCGMLDKLELAARIVVLYKGKDQDLISRGAIELIRISGAIASHYASSEATQLIDEWSQLRMFGRVELSRYPTDVKEQDICMFNALGQFGRYQDIVTQQTNSKYTLPVLTEDTQIGSYSLKNVVGWLSGS